MSKRLLQVLRAVIVIGAIAAIAGAATPAGHAKGISYHSLNKIQKRLISGGLAMSLWGRRRHRRPRTPRRAETGTVASFDVRWSGHGRPQKIRDANFGFAGEYVAGPATINFTARDDAGNVLFRSDPHGQYNPTPDQGGAGSPAVGHERNGVFSH